MHHRQCRRQLFVQGGLQAVRDGCPRGRRDAVQQRCRQSAEDERQRYGDRHRGGAARQAFVRQQRGARHDAGRDHGKSEHRDGEQRWRHGRDRAEHRFQRSGGVRRERLDLRHAGRRRIVRIQDRLQAGRHRRSLRERQAHQQWRGQSAADERQRHGSERHVPGPVVDDPDAGLRQPAGRHDEHREERHRHQHRQRVGDRERHREQQPGRVRDQQFHLRAPSRPAAPARSAWRSSPRRAASGHPESRSPATACRAGR